VERANDGGTGHDPAEVADAHGIGLVVVSLPEAKRGFVPLPGAGSSSDLPPGRPGSAGLHVVAFACLMLHRAIPMLGQSP
jgi:hypothetical protein